ncbi:flippase [Paenibacillus aceti]|uniref:Flippase n=2 Tax=Paenibacillus aceti TaxID=1820010 RepID=A0ABQ1VZR8_9BACL|nr:polysaccharide biosynthesis C-terminal domain-containing protein [Paenibacillus aceti]GGG07685.1 flippase [Paenibacillus aceti]
MAHKVRSNEYFVAIMTKFILVFLSMITSVLLNRYLGPSLKGEYSYILNIVGILALILNLGIGQSYTFFKKKNGDSASQEFVNIFYFQLILYIVLLLIINVFYKERILNFILIISILSQFNMQISFMSLVANVNKRNYITIVSMAIYAFFLLIIYLFTNNNLEIIIYIYIIKIVLESLLFITSNKLYPYSLKINFYFMLDILKFSLFPMVTSLLIVLNYSVDTIILKQFVDYSDIGIYSVGVTLAGIVWLIPDAFKDVLFNKTAKDNSLKDIVFGIKFNIYLSIIIIIGFSLLGKDFLYLMYGKEYIASYSVTLLLFVGCIPMIFFKILNTLYISNGNQKISFFILIAAVIANVIGNYILIPFMGISGAAISSIISYSVSGIILLLSFIKRYNIAIKEIVLFNENEMKKIKSIILKR